MMLLRFILVSLLMTASFAAAMPPTDPFLGKLSIDRAEYALDDESSYALETEARIGRDIDALLIKLEAEKEENSDTEGELKLLWSHAVSPYWDRTLGIAVDSGEGPDKAWLADISCVTHSGLARG